MCLSCGLFKEFFLIYLCISLGPDFPVAIIENFDAKNSNFEYLSRGTLIWYDCIPEKWSLPTQKHSKSL